MAKKNASNQTGGTFEPETKNTTPEQVGVSKELVEQLMGALIAGKTMGKQEAEVELVELVNVSGAALAFPVTERLTGREKHVSLERRGAKVKLTPEQVLEAKERFPHFFDNGLVSCAAVVPDNVNVVHDLQKFINELPASDVTTRIEQITSTDLLFALYHFIESQRFESEDASGQPFTEIGVDGKKMPVLKELTVDPKLIAVEVAVSRRLLALSGIKVAIDA